MEDDLSSGPMPRKPSNFIIQQLHDKCKLNPIIYTHHPDNTKPFTNRKILEGYPKSSKSYQFNLNSRTSSDAIVTYKLVLRSVVAKIYVSLAKFAVFFHRKELNRIERCIIGHVSLF